MGERSSWQPHFRDSSCIPPQFSVSDFPLISQKVQKRTSQRSKRQNWNHPQSSFLSNPLKDAILLHPPRAEQSGALTLRPGQ